MNKQQACSVSPLSEFNEREFRSSQPIKKHSIEKPERLLLTGTSKRMIKVHPCNEGVHEEFCELYDEELADIFVELRYIFREVA